VLVVLVLVLQTSYTTGPANLWRQAVLWGHRAMVEQCNSPSWRHDEDDDIITITKICVCISLSYMYLYVCPPCVSCVAVNVCVISWWRSVSVH